tara:strand:- start:20646 stop:21725 length:1080 start_codon:yes stop_codon:yes gene_type:complete
MVSVWGADPVFLDKDSETAQDWKALQCYLQSEGLSFDPELNAPKQFSSGFGNLNYQIIVNGSLSVLRRPPMGKIPPGANDMKREHHILSKLWKEFPLAPKSFHYCPDHSILGNHFLIMEYRKGNTISGHLPEEVALIKDAPVKITELLIDILVDLHNVDAETVGLGDFGKPEGFLERAVKGWKKRLFLGSDDSPPNIAIEVVNWLEKNQVKDGLPTLLHNDFKLDNILLDPKDLTPIAVVDWDMGSRGDPLFDLGTLLSYWVEPDDPKAMQIIEQMPTSCLSFPKRKDVIRMYSEKSGRDTSDIRFYRVLAQFKLAVVFLQINAQYKRGTTKDPRFGRFEEYLEDMFVFAHDIASSRVE